MPFPVTHNGPLQVQLAESASCLSFGISRPGTTEKTKTNNFDVTIDTGWCKTSDIVTDGTTMIGTRTREAATIAIIVMIEITPPTIINKERSSGDTMKTGADKDSGTTDTLI